MDTDDVEWDQELQEEYHYLDGLVTAGELHSVSVG